ncbi:aminopeptidase P family protein [Actimicrobium sp. CCI2.3]|uniref:aminopeptidase P family protein n=1 Tax=Actimicrobium sp. CCI2.3 TaxID=3048616 RepID=UPI002AB3E908|nr:aminopeptidase P family protein [Actimicrobium sp. CCI2.3]MDY7573230.1 aminopeptidase P family protein [Actimicrobium sp. CCI2.3]MEB0022864.1 aminopeptidase P family protein [Actimicrobium sp. CCI2.3]
METLHASRSLIHTRLAALRAALQHQQLAAYVVPSSDPHLSEYLPERWKGREWLSGFTGSVGTLIVTADFAGLWADSRYWSQAEAELAGTGIVLMKIPAGNSLQHIEWLAQSLQPGQVAGVDGAVLGLAAARLLEQAITARGATLRTDLDLFEQVWTDRPTLPTQAIYEHLPPHATMARADKLAQLRLAMQASGADWHLLSTLDDIAYLFNLRGADVNYNPIFVAHALVGLQQATIFVADGKVPVEVIAALAADGVQLAPYAQAATVLGALPDEAVMLLDPRRITLGLRHAVPDTVRVVEAINPTTFAKSRKSAAEAAHVRSAMEQDGAALCEFFSWLDLALGKDVVTELTIDEQITAARARRPGFVCPSFGTIAGFNANGAMPHYHATPASHAVIEGDGLLLIDSGGQYLGGTTDITRIVPVGQPSAAQRRDVTLVLKGVIALSSTQFPRGTRAPMLDAIARAPIWSAGIDYGHGTGHGVGYFMNVHEGPQVIAASAMPEPHTAMEPGMITSIEPGIYRPGKWGVRVENLVLNVPATSTEFGEYLRFETLTLCPIDSRCLDLALLRPDELAWLDNYHAMVRERLAPHVSGAAKAWLEQRTVALSPVPH